MTLADLKPNDRAKVESIGGDPALVQRLYELGLFEGEMVEFLGSAPLGDPLEFRVGNTRLSLRTDDAKSVVVLLEPGA